ncbi:hypothetical protein OIU78_015031 [Salix suchowensis]|nr:hypothetical protein OIU78_015031 [Salix suchowensis]
MITLWSSELHIHGSGYLHFRAYIGLVKAILLDRIKWICMLYTLLSKQISSPFEGFGLQAIHMDDLNLVVLAGKIFSDADQDLFDECLVKFEEDEVKQMETREKRELTWKRLEDLATSKAVSNEAVLVTSSVSSISIATGTSPRATAGG